MKWLELEGPNLKPGKLEIIALERRQRKIKPRLFILFYFIF